MSLFGVAQKAMVLCPDLVLDGFPVDGLVFDASISEQHVIERTATKFPIEFGAVVTDHIHRGPRAIAAQVFLSDTPTDFFDAGEEAIRNLQTAVAQTLGAPVVGRLASTRSKDMYEALEVLAASDAVCTVVTDLRIYENMVLLRLGAPRKPEDGRGLVVDLNFHRLTIARTSTGEAITIDEPLAPSPKPTKKVGKTIAKPPPEKPSSLLGRTDIAR